ncbi:RrF2 family transcriptional regulator [Clostridium perfringens]|uniref:RrF2 family transcriptional regulator n=1 Tax=Clostridium perfringens TaxID=1502 RepID=UPI0024BC0613|nr:Rrf2 family transcriptional regulator [Clostridium perfringens]
MQLKLSTDYAIRIVLYLSKKQQEVALKELCEKFIIEENYAIKFTKKLQRAGIVDINHDTQDIFLVKNPKEITLFDIINNMENTIKINHCLEKDRYCGCSATGDCSLRKIYCKLQSDIENTFKNTTIHDLLQAN